MELIHIVKFVIIINYIGPVLLLKHRSFCKVLIGNLFLIGNCLPLDHSCFQLDSSLLAAAKKFSLFFHWNRKISMLPRNESNFVSVCSRCWKDHFLHLQRVGQSGKAETLLFLLSNLAFVWPIFTRFARCIAK